MLIAGGIGGTETDLAIFPPESRLHTPLAQPEICSADYPGLQAIFTEFEASPLFENLMERMPIHIITTKGGSCRSGQIRNAELKYACKPRRGKSLRRPA